MALSPMPTPPDVEINEAEIEIGTIAGLPVVARFNVQSNNSFWGWEIWFDGEQIYQLKISKTIRTWVEKKYKAGK